MAKPSTPAVWASGKAFGFQPSAAQQAQGFDYIATVRPSTGAPITDDHDWPLNNITTSLKWVMDQLPDGGIQELLTALLPKRSFSANDFIRIPDAPGGLIIQWGTLTAPQTSGGVEGSLSSALPSTFPNGVLCSSASIYGPTVRDANINTATQSQVAINYKNEGTGQSTTVSYLVIGW